LILFANALAILHENRFLKKYGFATYDDFSFDAPLYKKRVAEALKYFRGLKIFLIPMNLAVISLLLIYGIEFFFRLLLFSSSSSRHSRNRSPGSLKKKRTMSNYAYKPSKANLRLSVRSPYEMWACFQRL